MSTREPRQARLDPMDLTAAFPAKVASDASLAAKTVETMLHPRQVTEVFAVLSCGEPVRIPARLHFATEALTLEPGTSAWLMARALQSRSNDGYQRQRAARDLLANLRPWTAPFIMALLGEYIVEILVDIEAGLTPESAAILAACIRENPAYWDLIKRRIMSYWHVYHRLAYSRTGYPGFRMIVRLKTESELG